MYLINPAIFKMKKGPVRVVTDGISIGQTIIATYPHDVEMEAWKDLNFTSAAIEVDEAALLKLISGS